MSEDGKLTICYMDEFEPKTFSGKMKLSLEENVIQVGFEGKTWTIPLCNLRYFLFEPLEDEPRIILSHWELEQKLDDIRELAPDLISWVITGVEWDIECESTRSPEEDDRIKREVEDLLKRFTEILEIKEEAEP